MIPSVTKLHLRSLIRPLISRFDSEALLPGWFGCEKSKQFDMSLDFQQQRSAGGWQISSPVVLGMAALEGALALTRRAGIDKIREKSLALTSIMIELVQKQLSSPPYSFSIGTPLEQSRRGGHLAIERKTHAWQICCALRQRGVVVDFRPPSTIRLAPVALYNTFQELFQVACHLKEIMDQEEYMKFPETAIQTLIFSRKAGKGQRWLLNSAQYSRFLTHLV